jgi:hypothetical protein
MLTFNPQGIYVGEVSNDLSDSVSLSVIHLQKTDQQASHPHRGLDLVERS